MSVNVDLDQVAHVIDRIAATEQDIESLAAELDVTDAGSPGAWTGVTAAAGARAHAELVRGFATMRTALHEMRAAATTAHSNYSCAADADLALWDEIR